MLPLLLSNEDVARLGDIGGAIRAVESAFRARASGTFVAPPRHNVNFPGHGDLVFTVGGITGERNLVGFRVYDHFKGIVDQLTVVWDVDAGGIQGALFGAALGELRTGAIGGVAIKYMASPEARILAVIGTGPQARRQLEAAAAVRQFEEVRIFSRAPGPRQAFAKEFQAKLNIAVSAKSTAQDAVADADVIICATSSAVPVIEAAWLKPGAHINMVGPKTIAQHELGLDVADAAFMIATDSLEQAQAYHAPFFLADSRHMGRMTDLADIVAGKAVARPSGGETTLFASVGLGGSEVLVAAALLAEAQRQG